MNNFTNPTYSSQWSSPPIMGFSQYCSDPSKMNGSDISYLSPSHPLYHSYSQNYMNVFSSSVNAFPSMGNSSQFNQGMESRTADQ